MQASEPSIWKCDCFSSHASMSKDTSSPQLILLCPWTGASTVHIRKYSESYHEYYPSTPVMAITTSLADLCFRSSTTKQKRLLPAVELLLSYQRILMHVFSEGGSNKACELAEAYRKKCGYHLPVSALCLDSTPGEPHYRRLCNAFSRALPPVPLMRPAGLLVGGAVLGCTWILYCGLRGFENNVVSQTRRRLVDGEFWDLRAPRCYLFSKHDVLISSEDISMHADESADKGIPVIKVEFQNSGHVQHAIRAPNRYWDAILKNWKCVA